MSPVSSPVLRKALLPAFAISVMSAATVGLGLLPAVPAHAQMNDRSRFLDAVKKADGEKVEQAIRDNGTIVNTADPNGLTALHIVAERRDLTWLGYLLGKGAKVNATDDRDRTALDIAVSLGWFEGAQELLQMGATPETTNDAGETPLIIAVHRKDTQVVKVLLQAGANPDRPDSSGRSARDYAKAESGGSSSMLATIDTYASKTAVKPRAATYGPSL